MTVGCLGDIVFEVSDETIRTVKNFTWSGSAKYAVHARHNNNALTEYTGRDADKITFDIYLDVFFGMEIQDELTRIWDYERNGEALSLVLGDKAYGKYRWNIISHSTKAENFDGRGNILNCTVSLTLQEYLKN